MNAAHLHLILNHIPIIGSFIAFFILLYGVFKKNEEVKKVALVLIIIMGVASFFVSKTGHKAEHLVEKIPGVSESSIEEHEEFGEKALIASEISAALALLTLLARMKNKSLASALNLLTLLSLLVSAAILSWTAKLGGEIRHPEIKPGFESQNHS